MYLNDAVELTGLASLIPTVACAAAAAICAVNSEDGHGNVVHPEDKVSAKRWMRGAVTWGVIDFVCFVGGIWVAVLAPHTGGS